MNIALFNTIVYLSGGVKYSVPNELFLTYVLTQLRFLLPYTVGIMAITVLLADFRFYQDFSNAIDEESNDLDNEDS